jgi:hypothetical protein
MDVSVLEHLKQIDNLKGELNQFMTEERLYQIIEHLTGIVSIQERNISTLQKDLENYEAYCAKTFKKIGINYEA